MQRFFAQINGKEACLDEQDKHRLLDVMRTRLGEKIEIVDKGKAYLAILVSQNPLQIVIEKPIEQNPELSSHLLLAFSLLKGGHDDMVLLKGTELGVAGFIPFCSERTIIKVKAKDQAQKLERAERIVKEAAMQSRRLIIPTVSSILDFKELLQVPADNRLFAYEDLSNKPFNLQPILEATPTGSTTLAVVGPEGGFSSEEATLAKEAGFTFVSLGHRILRAETASLFLASVFAYESEEKE